jgi:hypothetical protein
MTDPMTSRQRGTLVGTLSSTLKHGGDALGTAPKALRRLLEEDAWREFETTRGERVHHSHFADFVTTEPLGGLGATVDLVQRVVANDPATVDLLDLALKQTPGGDKRSNEYATTRNNVPSGPAGNSQAKALRRLRKDRPDLHAQVLGGELSAHAAAVQAGFRHRTISVPVERPDCVAAALRRHMNPADLAQLAALLAGDDA